MGIGDFEGGAIDPQLPQMAHGPAASKRRQPKTPTPLDRPGTASTITFSNANVLPELYFIFIENFMFDGHGFKVVDIL